MSRKTDSGCQCDVFVIVVRTVMFTIAAAALVFAAYVIVANPDG